MIKIIADLGQVAAPNQLTSLDLYVIDRGQGREVIHTCYKQDFWADYIAKGLIKPRPVPQTMRNSEIPYHPDVWAKKRNA